jgi:DNA-binding transcriptional LysR family regulator
MGLGARTREEDVARTSSWPRDHEQLRAHAVTGVGLLYALEPTVADELARGLLRVVLETYAPVVPGLFLYFPSRAQVSPALKAFVQVAREVTSESKPR